MSKLEVGQLSESVTVQSEAAITNHPLWSNPNGSVTSGSFMKINSTRGGARYVRFGARIEF